MRRGPIVQLDYCCAGTDASRIAGNAIVYFLLRTDNFWRPEAY